MDTEYNQMLRLFENLNPHFSESTGKIVLYDGNGFNVEFNFDADGYYTGMKVVEL